MMIEMREREDKPGSSEATLTCEEFQAQMPELVGSNSIHEHPHLKTCERCSALLADLEYIAQSLTDFFPLQEPRDEVWKKIQDGMIDADSEQKETGGPEKRK
jgi:hypothetical protein